MKRTTMLMIAFCLLFCSLCAYTPTIARQMAYMSAVAYESAASIRAWNCNPCKDYPMSDVRVFTSIDGSIQGFAAHSTALNAIILSFRGSANTANWIANLDFKQTAYDGCTGCAVHLGFLTDWNIVRNSVLINVQALKNTYRTASLWVTGHSLGGSLAILASAELKKIYGSVAGVYDFGQPRVGNAQFAQYYQGAVPETYRVIHYADVVPHLPPSAFGFQHSSHQIWFQETMSTYKECLGDSPSCSNSLPASSLSTKDHDMTNYLRLKAITISKE